MKRNMPLRTYKNEKGRSVGQPFRLDNPSSHREGLSDCKGCHRAKVSFFLSYNLFSLPPGLDNPDNPCLFTPFCLWTEGLTDSEGLSEGQTCKANKTVNSGPGRNWD